MYRYVLKYKDPFMTPYDVYHEKKFSPFEFLTMYNEAIEKAPTKTEYDPNLVVEEEEVVTALCDLYGFVTKEEKEAEVVIQTSQPLFHKVDMHNLDEDRVSNLIDISNLINEQK